MRLIGHSDQGGRPDGVQLMVHRGFAYVGHMFSKGFSVLDVRDASNPHAVNYIAAPPNTWNIHLQTQDDLLLVIHAKDMFAAAEFADERAYYKGALGQKVGTADASRARDWSPGLTVYDIAIPERPRQIGFLQVQGGGIHRLWYTGGRWAYASALLDGFTHYIFITIDMIDPTAPREAGPMVDSRNEFGSGRDPLGKLRAVTDCITRSLMVTLPMRRGAMPAWLCSMSLTAASQPRSSIATGPRRSAAAPTIACRLPTANYSWCWTKPYSIIRKTD